MGRSRVTRPKTKLLVPVKNQEFEDPQFSEPANIPTPILYPKPIRTIKTRAPVYPYLCQFDLVNILGKKTSSNNLFEKKKFSVAENDQFSPLLSRVLLYEYLLNPLFIFLNPRHEYSESKIGIYPQCRLKNKVVMRRFFLLLTKNNLAITDHDQYACYTCVCNDIIGMDFTLNSIGIKYVNLNQTTAYYSALNSHKPSCKNYLNTLQSKLKELTQDNLDSILNQIDSRFETILLFKLDTIFPEELKTNFRSYVQNTLENNIALLKATTNAR